MTIDLATLILTTQSEMDDASEDHIYVGDTSIPPLPPTRELAHLMVKRDDGLVTQDVADALALSLVNAAKIWRANGGIGRAVVSFYRQDQELHGLVLIWTSPRDELSLLRPSMQAV